MTIKKVSSINTSKPVSGVKGIQSKEKVEKDEVKLNLNDNVIPANNSVDKPIKAEEVKDGVKDIDVSSVDAPTSADIFAKNELSDIEKTKEKIVKQLDMQLSQIQAEKQRVENLLSKLPEDAKGQREQLKLYLSQLNDAEKHIKFNKENNLNNLAKQASIYKNSPQTFSTLDGMLRHLGDEIKDLKRMVLASPTKFSVEKAKNELKDVKEWLNKIRQDIGSNPDITPDVVRYLDNLQKQVDDFDKVLNTEPLDLDKLRDEFDDIEEGYKGIKDYKRWNEIAKNMDVGGWSILDDMEKNLTKRLQYYDNSYNKRLAAIKIAVTELEREIKDLKEEISREADPQKKQALMNELQTKMAQVDELGNQADNLRNEWYGKRQEVLGNLNDIRNKKVQLQNTNQEVELQIWKMNQDHIRQMNQIMIQNQMDQLKWNQEMISLQQAAFREVRKLMFDQVIAESKYTESMFQAMMGLYQ